MYKCISALRFIIGVIGDPRDTYDAMELTLLTQKVIQVFST